MVELVELVVLVVELVVLVVALVVVLIGTEMTEQLTVALHVVFGSVANKQAFGVHPQTGLPTGQSHVLLHAWHVSRQLSPVMSQLNIHQRQ